MPKKIVLINYSACVVAPDSAYFEDNTAFIIDAAGSNMSASQCVDAALRLAPDVVDIVISNKAQYLKLKAAFRHAGVRTLWIMPRIIQRYAEREGL